MKLNVGDVCVLCCDSAVRPNVLLNLSSFVADNVAGKCSDIASEISSCLVLTRIR